MISTFWRYASVLLLLQAWMTSVSFATETVKNNLPATPPKAPIESSKSPLVQPKAMAPPISTTPTSNKIDGLAWDQIELVYDDKKMTKDQHLPLVLYLNGRFSRPYSNILYKNKKVPISAGGNFSIREPVDKKVMDFRFTGIHQDGTLEYESLSVVIPALPWNQAMLWKNPPKSPKRLFFSTGAGFTYLSYSEAFLTTRMDALALTGKFIVQYFLIPGHLTLSGNVYANLLPVTLKGSSEVSSGLPESRFYGASATINWQLPFKTKNFSVFFGTGWYAWGMLVFPQDYGISLLQGPQFLLAFSTRIARRSSSLYLKVAPISAELGQITMTSRELAFGLRHNVTPPDAKRDWTITLDVSNMATFNAEQNNSVELSTVSLGIQTNVGSNK